MIQRVSPLFLLFFCLFLVSSASGCSSDCPFLGDSQPLVGILQPGQTLRFNFSVDVLNHFSVFFVNFSGPANSLSLAVPGNPVSWPASQMRGFSTIVVQPGLTGLQSACRVSPIYPLCSIMISLFCSSFCSYRFFSHFDDLANFPQADKFSILQTGKLINDNIGGKKWRYYGILLRAEDFDVSFTLTPEAASASSADLYLAREKSPLSFFFPDNSQAGRNSRNPITVVVNANGDSASAAGFYILGVYSPGSSSSSSLFSLSADGNFVSTTPFSISLIGIIGALAVFVLLIAFSVIFVARRRQSSRISIEALRGFEREGALHVQLEIRAERQGNQENPRRILLNGFFASLQRVEEPPRPPSPTGLSAAEFSALPEILFKQEKTIKQEEPASCSICLGEFSTGDRLRCLPCAHLYHTACIQKWLSSKRLCPLCRAAL